ncbi:hypothetical protein [Congregibacter sp.]|uniref:hypothetical protein n=1 Tax=Congregibacter sp. TaxID=2744308 RepID=UPI003F6B8F4B
MTSSEAMSRAAQQEKAGNIDEAKRSNPGVRFVLSTEKLEEGNLKLQNSGRFAHSHDYVQRCAVDAGLQLVHSEEIPLRKERGEWLAGELFVFTL